MPHNIVIVGASGFVGKNLCKYARDKGCTVLGLEGEDKRFKASHLEDAHYFRGVELAVCDLYNSGELASRFQGRDAVYDFVGISKEDGDSTFEKVNIGVTTSIAKACREAGIKRLIYNSGLGVAHLGDMQYPKVQNRYFASLKGAEDAIKGSGVPYTIFRPSYIIGKDDLFSSRIRSQIDVGTVNVLGAGKEKLQPIFIDDACEIYLKAPNSEWAEDQAFDLVGPQELTFLEYVKALIPHCRARLARDGNEIIYRAMSKKEAVEKFGMSPEQADIRTCDEVSDHTELEDTFDIRLKKPEEFLKLIYQSPKP